MFYFFTNKINLCYIVKSKLIKTIITINILYKKKLEFRKLELIQRSLNYNLKHIYLE